MHEKNDRLKWYQFSLRSLLVGVLLVSLMFAVVRHHLAQLQREMVAVSELRKLDAVISYTKGGVDEEVARWRFDSLNGDIPPEARQQQGVLRKIYGADCLPVFEVWLCGNHIGDKDLVTLKNLPDLESVILQRTSVTGKGFTYLKYSRHLDRIEISSSPITNSSLVQIGQFTSLSELGLSDTRITDSGLTALSQLHHLQVLFLNKNPITDEGLQHLSKLTNLWYLSLRGTSISDSGLQHLHDLSNLEILDISETDISDTGLQHLKYLKNLKQVWAQPTLITNKGIRELHKYNPNAAVVIGGIKSRKKNKRKLLTGRKK